MVKVTEKLLLEKGTPKTNKLDEIRTLNLSGLGLNCKDLPVPLLSRLRNLEQLNLSGNRLQELPRGLSLPSLRMLDCSNNNMEDVTSLESLHALEELRLQDNVYLTASDNCKVMFFLPKLSMLNGKDIRSSANHLRHVNHENLKKRVVQLWETKFSLPNPPTENKLKALESDFVNAVCTQIKFGPSTHNDYTKWRVEILAKEHLCSLMVNRKGREEEDVNTKHINGIPSTPKRKIPDTDACKDEGSAMKRGRTTVAPPPESRSRTFSHLRSSPPSSDESLCSHRRSGRIVASSNGEESRMETPKKCMKATPKKRANEDGMSVQVTIPESEGLVGLKPLHVLQCHSKQDSPEDFGTQLWACAFEPSRGDSGQTSEFVATCGGESICLIHCESGLVQKKYKVPGEEFFSLSWSRVMMSRGNRTARPCSILAAGGKRGVVKLIHPRVSIAYGEFRASRRSISTLRFSARQQSILFTGAYDNKIVMWDIGDVDSDYNFKVQQLLVLQTSSTPLHLCLPPNNPDTHLLAACDKGMLCFNIQLNKNKAQRSADMEVTFPAYKKEDKHTDYHTIDGLAFLTDDVVVSKCFTLGSIYLWSWSRTRASRPNNNSEVSAVILAVLQWSSTDLPYLSLSTCPSKGYVMCGDEKGAVWMYHVTEILKNKGKNFDAAPPTKVLQWPSPFREGVGTVEGASINSVAADPQLNYLVALTDKNMVVVWKRITEF
ncbi:leucine-rich repeat and WD repeat-containing protein 1 [Scleropages formosus]|nr:leucine-rich repeat and WD repeat-containing protein 1 [Scleropages formosus]